MDPFTDKVKKPLACPYCSVRTCLKCAKTCALQWASRPKCASCNKAFTSEVLDGMFKKSFRRGRLRQAAILNLIDQETSLLPHTMEVLNQRRNQTTYDAAHYQLSLNLDLLRRLIPENSSEVDAYIAECKALGQQMRDTGITSSKKSKRETRQRSTKCPGADCRGYIMGQGSCVLCGTRVCGECNAALKGAEVHVCQESDIATWALIKASTKPCPTCGTGIEKISGCNQMWCTVPECNTAFDWASGQKINGPIHNPHYHDWLREGRADVGNLNANVACEVGGQVFNHRRTQEIYECIGQSYQGRPHEPLYNTAFQYMRALPEAADGRYRRADVAYTQDLYQEMRIEYLENKITREHWASKLSHRETLRTKTERLNALLAMFEAASSDLFVRLHSELEAVRTVGQLPARRPGVSVAEALPIVKAFVRGCESLRLYFCAELARCISDYSNRTVRALVWDPSERGLVLTWTNASVASLNGQQQAWITAILDL